MFKLPTSLFLAATLLAACTSRHQASDAAPDIVPTENARAKQMLQGIWTDAETGQVSFRVVGDTIFYPDSTMTHTAFRIVGDSICLGDNDVRYAIVTQTDNIFTFENQNGDQVRLHRSTTPLDTLAFATKTVTPAKTLTQVRKTDGVAMAGDKRLHWYIALNPTRYRVNHTTYNDEGVAVENTFYDNLAHLSVYLGTKAIFSRDIRKTLYSGTLPQHFISSAILDDFTFQRADNTGLHFTAKLCIPDEASCYMVDTHISTKGEISLSINE